MQNNDFLIEISVFELFLILKKRIVWILSAATLAAVISYLITTIIIVPKYSACVTMYVYSNTDRDSAEKSISSSDITASKSLVDTYIVILKSNTVLNRIKEDLKLDMSYKDLYNSITAASVNRTEVFSVSVINEDPRLAADIANAIAKIAPSEIIRVVKAGGVEIVDYAKIPIEQISPNLFQNVLLAFLIGGTFSFLAFVLYNLLDTRVNNKTDLFGKFSLPVLGEIPKIDIDKHTVHSEGDV